MDRVRVRVPATTANLGPGFDCLGLALDIYNTVEAARASSFALSVFGEGEDQPRYIGASLPRGRDNLVYRALAAAYERAGRPLPEVRLSCHNAIPLRRGLGSSAAAIVGGLAAANFLMGEPLSQEELLRLGVDLEGHPDNVAPALLGGCQVVVQGDGSLTTASIPLPPQLQVALFIPDLEMPTREARAILPDRVSREDAVFNIGRVALMVGALTSGKVEDLTHLKIATQDRLHQPYRRERLFPALDTIIQAALDAGALGAFLSGGGSAVAALTLENGEGLGRAMQQAAAQAGVKGSFRIAAPSLRGAHQVES